MDLSLNDIVRIVVATVLGGLSIIGGMFAWDKRATIGAVLGALRRRYVTVSFDGFLQLVEDARNPHSDAAEPARNAAVPEVREPIPADGNAIAIDDLIVLLSGIPIIGRDGTVGYLSQDKLATLYGGRRADALLHVKELCGVLDEPDPAQPAKRQIALRHNGVEELVEVDW